MEGDENFVNSDVRYLLQSILRYSFLIFRVVFEIFFHIVNIIEFLEDFKRRKNIKNMFINFSNKSFLVFEFSIND